MQASQGLRISIKDCCNFERISGLAFSIFTGDQTFLQWTNKRVIVSIITNPRAWSKTMGIASSLIKKTDFFQKSALFESLITQKQFIFEHSMFLYGKRLKSCTLIVIYSVLFSRMSNIGLLLLTRS